MQNNEPHPLGKEQRGTMHVQVGMKLLIFGSFPCCRLRKCH
jgi:hypothetical protein